LVLDSSGNLYGTTGFGGSKDAGTVFKLDFVGTETLLHSFTGSPDGASPYAEVVLDADGNLYGTAHAGGIFFGTELCPTLGCGVLFKVDSSGTETVLASFDGVHGEGPGSLVLDSSGNLYGTTGFGGSKSWGTVFKWDTAGRYTELYNFSGGVDGGVPSDILLDGTENLYGTTSSGGIPACNDVGCGTLFKIDLLGPADFLLEVSRFGNGSGRLTSNPPGIDCPGSCFAFFNNGTTVTLTPRAAAGSTFAGWSGDCSGTGTCSLIINSAKFVYEAFLLDFSLSASTITPSTVGPGASSTSTVNVDAGASGFSDSVALSCSIQPLPALAPTCSINPSSTTSGNSATLTVRTTAPMSGAIPPSGGRFGLSYAVWLLFGLIAARVHLGQERYGKAKITAVVLACLLFAGLVFQVACGGDSRTNGGDSRGTPAGAYTITVNGVDSTGFLKHSATTTLTVQ